MTVKTYDPDCAVLAKSFLAEEHATPDDVHRLALAIQEAVEDWFAGRDYQRSLRLAAHSPAAELDDYE